MCIRHLWWSEAWWIERTAETARRARATGNAGSRVRSCYALQDKGAAVSFFPPSLSLYIYIHTESPSCNCRTFFFDIGTSSSRTNPKVFLHIVHSRGETVWRKAEGSRRKAVTVPGQEGLMQGHRIVNISFASNLLTFLFHDIPLALSFVNCKAIVPTRGREKGHSSIV